MTQNSKNLKEKEESFDDYYNKQILGKKNKLKNIDRVCEKVKRKYEDYEETEQFVEYLQSIEKVFAQADAGKWSIEKTQDEMIKGEIYLFSQQTGISEEIFNNIYEEFKAAKNDVEKVQKVADELMDKYALVEGCIECEDCQKFIRYVKESLFMFAKTFGGDEAFDEIEEVKAGAIRMKMQLIAESGKPPIEILQEIYSDFVTGLKQK